MSGQIELIHLANSVDIYIYMRIYYIYTNVYVHVYVFIYIYCEISPIHMCVAHHPYTLCSWGHGSKNRVGGVSLSLESLETG